LVVAADVVSVEVSDVEAVSLVVCNVCTVLILVLSVEVSDVVTL
jgi:hypothetical protein